jgi:hypothetical protein
MKPQSLTQPVRCREEQRFRQLWIWLLVVLAAATATVGGCGGETNPAMKLQFADRVFVPVVPAALPAGGAPGTYANLHSYFVHTEATFGDDGAGPAVVVYSNVRHLPAGTTYVPTRVKVFFEAAATDSEALGVIVNPNLRSVEAYTISKPELRSAIPRVMQSQPLRFEVHTAG